MSVQNNRVTVAVSGHWLLGCLPLADTRIQEALNDFRTDFVKLTDVEVHPLDGCECVRSLPELVVPKGKIEFLVVPTAQHEAPVKRWNNLTAKAVFEAFAVVSDYRISGKLHLTKPSDSQFALREQLGRFFALTEASLSVRCRGDKQLRVPLLFANKDFVSCLHVGQPAAGEDTVEAEHLHGRRDNSLPCETPASR